ncbi:MAG: sugar O-acetyltransferase [Eubacteriales bacterium]|nr:sugar O-acetyltransferase [Eubacteriales bacterium]
MNAERENLISEDAFAPLHRGEIYDPGIPEIMEKQLTYLDDVFTYNQIPPSNLAERRAQLESMFAEFGEDSYIEAPFYSNMGARHCHFGRAVYANFGLCLVDDSHIYVGDHTMIGPNVVIATAAHPICPDLRLKNLQYNLPVEIGRNCWIGASAVILPGVKIGDGSVIGAGSIVTRDIPAGVVACGNPCRVLREIGPEDRLFYAHGREIDPGLFD